MLVYFKNQSVKFHPDSTSNDGALGVFENDRSNNNKKKKNNNNKKKKTRE